MSVEAMNWALKQETGQPGTKLLLLVLANYADADGVSWYSQKRLSSITEQTKKTVSRNLKRLEDLDLLKREKRAREDGSRSSDICRLMMDEGGDTMTPPPEKTSPGWGHERGEGGDTTGGAISESTGEPTNEPSLKEEFHGIWCEVTKHSRAEFSPTRRKRYGDIIKDIRKREPEAEPLRVFLMMMNAVWSNPWRHEEMNRHDPVTIFKRPEQRESWIEVALTEMAAGRDGTTHHQPKEPGRGQAESHADGQKRKAILERQKADEEARELEEIRLGKEETEKASNWFLGLTKVEQGKVEEEVTHRMVKDFPGVPTTNLLKKTVFLNLWKERTAA